MLALFDRRAQQQPLNEGQHILVELTWTTTSTTNTAIGATAISTDFPFGTNIYGTSLDQTSLVVDFPVVVQLTVDPAEMQRRQAESEARIEESRRQLAIADECANETLQTLLTPAQRRTWQDARFIEVVGPSGARYEINGTYMAGNITVNHDGQTATLCAHIASRMPLADNVIAQMLAISHHEATFLATANVQEGGLSNGLLALRQLHRAPPRSPILGIRGGLDDGVQRVG